MDLDNFEVSSKLKSWRVLQVSTGAAGGAGLAARRLNRELNSAGITSNFIALHSNSFIPESNEYDFKRSFISSLAGAVTTKFNHLFSRKILFTILGRSVLKGSDIASYGKPESTIIHLHNYYNFIDLKFIRKLVNLGYKLVITLHDQRVMTGGCHYALECSGYLRSCEKCPRVFWPLKYLPKRNLANSKETFRLADRNITFIAPSMWIYNEAKNSSILENSKIVFIPNILGNEFPSYSEKLHSKTRESNELILGVASMDPNSYVKGGDIVNETMSLLIDKKIKSKLLFLSDFPNKENSKVQDFWSQIDFLLVLSRAENSANVIHEAKFFGVPIIATKVGGTTELLHENFDIGIDLTDLNPKYIVSIVENILIGNIKAVEKSEMLKAHNKYVSFALTKHFDLYTDILV